MAIVIARKTNVRRHLILLSCCLSVHQLAAASSCWERAAERYGLSVLELGAHACVESAMRPEAINTSHQARTGTVDLGLMQINSGNLPGLARQGITREQLLSDPCTNLMVGAQILAERKARYGDSWVATGAYNASCTQLKGAACDQARAAYAWKVYRAMQRLGSEGHC